MSTARLDTRRCPTRGSGCEVTPHRQRGRWIEGQNRMKGRPSAVSSPPRTPPASRRSPRWSGTTSATPTRSYAPPRDARRRREGGAGPSREPRTRAPGANARTRRRASPPIRPSRRYPPETQPCSWTRHPHRHPHVR